jgi:hypothetical protein
MPRIAGVVRKRCGYSRERRWEVLRQKMDSLKEICSLKQQGEMGTNDSERVLCF